MPGSRIVGDGRDATGTIIARPAVHEVEALPLQTAPPEMGVPSVGQVHNLRAVGINDATLAEGALSAAGVGNAQAEGQSIAQAAGSAAGAGDATAEGATVTAEPPEANASGGGFGTGTFGTGTFGGPSVPLQVNDAVSASTASSPTLTAHDPPGSTSYRARDVIRSSTWTGRRSVEEQVTVIRAFAPDAMAAAEQLRIAIHERRRNDPADADAMEALKELHWAIGELIREAERGPVSAVAWEAFERNREKLAAIANIGGSLAAAAPTAVVLANFLSWLSGVPNASLLGEVYAAVLATGGGYVALRKGRRVR